MKEPTLFKIRLLKEMAYNYIGDILNIKATDKDGNLYYYDEFHRWCYQEGNKENIDWVRVKSKPRIKKPRYLDYEI